MTLPVGLENMRGGFNPSALVSKMEGGLLAASQLDREVGCVEKGWGLWHLVLALGECGLLRWWTGKPPTWFRVREDLSSGQEDPLSSKGGIVVSGKSLHLAF